MGKIYVVRHGECVWNVEDKITGITDVALTEKGIEQAKENARVVAESGIRPDLIIHSPLSRAAFTAQCISEAIGVPMKMDNRLHERDFGVLEGAPRKCTEYRSTNTQFANRYETGESLFTVAARIYGLLDELKAAGGDYMLVAHTGVCRVVRTYFEDMTNEEFANMMIPNCGMLTFEFK